jgi:fructosamine-3-kinase
VSGGCIHRCYRATIAGAPRFLKVNASRFADAFAAEADGLHALRGAGVRAPEPLRHGVQGKESYLLLEWLDLRHAGDWAGLGRTLAECHRRELHRRDGAAERVER